MSRLCGGVRRESLSSMEAPVAVEFGEVTFVVQTGLADVRPRAGTEGDSDGHPIGDLRVSALTQLPNHWGTGLSCFGRHASEPTNVFRAGKGCADNAALSFGSCLGAASGGNASGVVRETAPRRCVSRQAIVEAAKYSS